MHLQKSNKHQSDLGRFLKIAKNPVERPILIFFLVFILVIHIVLSTVFALSLPIWESYDEPAHYEYTRYIALNNKLPTPGDSWTENYEFHQPPLYYWVMAEFIKPIDLNDNIKYEFIWSPIFDVKPEPGLYAYPWTGTALATHVIRLVTAILSGIGVLTTFFASLALFPGRYKIALIAMCVHAFWPMYVFMSGTISNDNIIAWCGSWVILFSLRMLNCPQKFFDFWGLTFSWFLGVLSKDNAIALTIICGFTVAIYVLRFNQHSISGAIIRGLIYLGVFAGFGGLAVYISDGRSLRQFEVVINFIKSGLFGVISSNTPVVQSDRFFSLLNLSKLIEIAQGMLRTFFGVFSRASFELPASWYNIAGVFAVCLLGGLIMLLYKTKRRLPVFIVLAEMTIIVLIPALRGLSSGQAYAANGRFALPAMTALGIAVALALTGFPRRLSCLMSGIVISGLFFVSLFTSLLIVRPLYAKPLLYAGDAKTFLAPNPTSIRYGDEIELIGFTVPQLRSERNSTINFFPYWKPLKPITKNYILRIEVFGRDGESFGILQDQIPGGGFFPTSQWKPGDIYAEGFWAEVYEKVDVPAIAKYRLSWIDPDTKDALPVRCGEVPCQLLVGDIPVELDSASAAQFAQTPEQGKFSGLAALLKIETPTEAKSGETLSISIVWKSLMNAPKNTTAFVHIVNSEGKIIAQFDEPPRYSKYPMWAWRNGEIIPEIRVIDIPSDTIPGEYRVLIGMYDSVTLKRLSLMTYGDNKQKDDSFFGPTIYIR